MKFCDFKWLDLPQQAGVICRAGIYLGDRGVDDLFVALYRVYDFYVEVYYRCRDSEIVKLISFHSETLLEPYLCRIDIAKAFSCERELQDELRATSFEL